MTLTVPTPPEHRVVTRRLSLAWLLSGGCVAVIIGLTMIFILTFVQDMPIKDQTTVSAKIAFAAHDGQFSMRAIVGKYNGSRAIWTNGITYAMSALTQWDVVLENWITLLIAGIIFLTLIRLAAFDLTARLPLAITLIAALVFALNHQYSWVWALHNSSFFFVMFFLLAVYVLRVLPRGWQAVLLAVLFCFASSFSLQQGIMAWPTVFLVLIGRGYRSRWTYLFWAVASVVWISLIRWNGARYLVGSELTIIPTDIGLWIKFVLAMLGAPLASTDVTLAAVVGTLGLIVFGINVVYLGLVQRRWLLVSTWGAIGLFSIGLAFLISLVRLEVLGLERSLITWYYIHTVPLWLAIAVMSLESLHALRHRPMPSSLSRQRVRLITSGAAGFLLVLTGLYLYSNVTILQQTEIFFGKPFGSDAVGQDETCMAYYPFTGNDSCLRMVVANVPEGLADRQLALFRHQTRLSLLPAAYVPGDTIVFDSSERGVHRIIDSMWFPAVKQHVFHVVAPANLDNPEVDNRLTVAEIPQAISAALTEQLWYVTTNGNTDLAGFAALMADEYTLVDSSTDGQLVVAQFRRLPRS